MARNGQPQLIPRQDNPDQIEAYSDFVSLATSRPFDTQQTITDMLTGQPSFEKNGDIAASIARVLHTSKDGIQIEFDPDTWDAVYADKQWQDSVKEFNGNKSQDEKDKIRLEFTLHSLGILALRLDKFRGSKSSRKGRRVA